MKIITLNIWGGQIKEPLKSFFNKYKNDVDIFCLQEVYKDAILKTKKNFENSEKDFDSLKNISSILSEYNFYFIGVSCDYFGQAVFIKKNITVDDWGDFIIFDNLNNIDFHERKAQYIKFKYNEKNFIILNIYGHWNGKGKTDTEERVKQSKVIRDFIDNSKEEKIVLGDFNLLPETESLRIIENGMENLVKDYNVQSTRTSLYTRHEISGKFADYIFLSPSIKVKDFKVLPDEVSDHTALFLEI